MSDFRTIYAIDFDKHAVETYRANVSIEPGRVLCGKVGDLLEQLPAADIVLGGFPCQPHSFAGKREASADERDGGDDFIAAIAKVRPRMFLGENVPGILSSEGGKYVQRFVSALESLGYVVEVKTLDAVNFGVPQFRARVWFWGIRRDVFESGVSHRWPKPTHAWPPPDQACMFGGDLLPAVTIGRALGLEAWATETNTSGGMARVPRSPDQPSCSPVAGGHAMGGLLATRRTRGSGVIRRDHPVSEPSPTLADGSGGIFQMIQSHADPARTIDAPSPSPSLRSGGAGHDGCCLRIIGGGSNPHFAGDARTDRDITDEPSTTLPTSDNHQNALPQVHEYRWSDKMREKHPPASPASPAPTVLGKWAKGGSEGLLTISSKQKRTTRTTRTTREPAGTLAGDSRHALSVRRLTPDECGILQSLPADFVWPASVAKTHRYRIIGNGQASEMCRHLAAAFKAADPASVTVIDLFCGGGVGAVGWHGRSRRFD